jgi:hypothetical protein
MLHGIKILQKLVWLRLKVNYICALCATLTILNIINVHFFDHICYNMNLESGLFIVLT